MSPRARAALWVVIGLGTVVRLGIAFRSTGTFFDLESLATVQRGLVRYGFDVYSAVNGNVSRWPYPPGYFPLIGAIKALANASGGDFYQLIRLPPIAADAALAWLVQYMLGRRGVPDAARVAAAAAVAFGPIFVGTSGYQGQIDSVAILPAVAALAVWEGGRDSRALRAGLLIGLGAAVKTAPILMLFALGPLARSRRELAVLAAAALAVPCAALAPFAASNPRGVAHALSYHGLIGLGSISLAVQPDLALAWLVGVRVHVTGLAQTLHDSAPLVLGPALAALAVVLRRRAVEPAIAAALVWLTFYVFGVNFLMQYLVWGLPFFILVVGWRWPLALQVVLTPAMLLVFLRADSQAEAWALYTVPVLAAWVAFAVVLVATLRRITASRASGSTRACRPAGSPSR